jgi:hypothetical protein
MRTTRRANDQEQADGGRTPQDAGRPSARAAFGGSLSLPCSLLKVIPLLSHPTGAAGPLTYRKSMLSLLDNIDLR